MVLTYLTNPPKDWFLGVTAAWHGVTLVLVGEGRRWTNGGADKLKGAAQAIELIRELSPSSPIIFADGLDTLVSNPLSHDVSSTLKSLVQQDGVLFASECASFPKCYSREYDKNRAHKACRSRSKTCFLNSGLYAGSSRALLRMLPLADRVVKRLHGSEQGEDQAAAHRVMLGKNNSDGSLSVDDQNRVFLTLRGCRGSPDKAFYVKGRRFSTCFYEPHEPLQYVTRVGSSLRFQANHSRRAEVQTPLVVHANGYHARLTWAVPCVADKRCPRWQPAYTSKPYAGGGVTDLLKQRPELLQYPIMLINSSAATDVCTMVPLGKVLDRAAHPTFMKGSVRSVG